MAGPAQRQRSGTFKSRCNERDAMLRWSSGNGRQTSGHPPVSKANEPNCRFADLTLMARLAGQRTLVSGPDTTRSDLAQVRRLRTARMLSADGHSTQTSASHIFGPGRNCATVARARRVATLIDGEDYFRTLHRAAELATESIIILAWDLNTNTRLHYDESAGSAPAVLGESHELPREAAARPAHLHAQLGLPDDLRAKPRNQALIWSWLETATPGEAAVRQHTSGRCVSTPEARGDR